MSVDATETKWIFHIINSLPLHYNGHFPGEHGLAGVYEAKDGGSSGDNWNYKSWKAPVKSSPPTNQQPVFFTGRMPFLSPNQHCQSTEGNNITFPGLVYPKLTWGLPTLSLATNSSWLPWGRFAMPLISPLMQYPISHHQLQHKISKNYQRCLLLSWTLQLRGQCTKEVETIPAVNGVIIFCYCPVQQ